MKNQKLFLKTSRCNGVGELLKDKTFLVRKGSIASAKLAKTMPLWAKALEGVLIANGKMKKSNKGYVFMKDVVFPSASAAACVIAGRSENGLSSWITKDGTPLRDMIKNVFYLKANGSHARGELLSDGRFLVCKGSKISENSTPSMPFWAETIFGNLVSQDIIDDFGKFVQRHVFDSSSAAACVIAGASKNGLDAWKSIDGKPLKEFI